MSITPENLLKQLQWRYAVKMFDSKRRIPEDKWEALERALILTPSSYGLQPWRFIIVTSNEIKKRLTPVSKNQPQVESCSHHVVFLARTEMIEKDVDQHIIRASEVREHPPDRMARWRETVLNDLTKGARAKVIREWAARQIYIALGNFMTAAALLYIDTCPMEGIDTDAYDLVLGVEGTGYHSIVSCAAGYRSQEDKYQTFKKVRFPQENTIIRM